MNKKNSPQTRPGSVRRRKAQSRGSKPATKPELEQSRLRRLLPAILIPHGVSVLLVVVVAVAILLFSATSMAALPATIAQLWLVLNASPVSGNDQVIGVVPLVPPALLVWAMARRVHMCIKDRASIADLGTVAGLVLIFPLLLAGIAALMLNDASAVFAVAIPPLPSMLGRIFLLHLIALALGMGPRLWRALARRYRIPEWPIDAAISALAYLKLFAITATIVTLVSLLFGAAEFISLLGGYEQSTAAPALVVLSLLYLPNLIIYTMGILVGAPLHFGEAVISLFSVHLVPLPPLPILAAVPSSAPVWLSAGVLLPIVLAIWHYLRKPMSLRVNMVVALAVATAFLVLSLFAGGLLGVYGYVGVDLLLAFGLLLGYLIIIALAIAGLDRLRTSRLASQEVLEEVEEEVEEDSVADLEVETPEEPEQEAVEDSGEKLGEESDGDSSTDSR